MLEVADIPAQGSQGAYKYLQLNLPGSALKVLTYASQSLQV